MKKTAYYPAFPGGKMKMFTTSYDDGNDCDARLVELLRKHGARGTFNVNSWMYDDDEQMPESKARLWRRMDMDEALALYGDDMEIAVHGAVHPWWDKLSPVNAMQDILSDKQTIERMTGRIIRGAAYPWGTFNDNVVEILRQAGFAYCRAVAVTKKLKTRSIDPLRYQGTIRHRDPEAIDLARRFAEADTLDGQLCTYYLWGHTYEFMQKNNWNIVEEILDIVGDREDVWYCTNIEYFDYMAATKELRFDVDRTMVENPTATDIWLRGGRKYYDPEPIFLKVPAGATVKLD